MRHRPALRAAALALALVLSGAAASSDNPPLAQDALVRWSASDTGFGSFSALELSPDGARFVAVTDKGAIFTGRAIRDDGGRLTDLAIDTSGPLLDERGEPLSRYDTDAEGIAFGPDGLLYVSFEANHRVLSYSDLQGPATALPRPAAFREFQHNSGLEALFAGPDGAVYAIPERSGREDRPFPVYRFDGQDWAVAFTLPRRPPHLVTGADLGPDGRLYVLERHFSGFSFSTRIRSFAIDAQGLSDEQMLLESRGGDYDNMEGISAWADAQGRVRLTTISDDNGFFLQRTEVAEFIVAPVAAPPPDPRPE